MFTKKLRISSFNKKYLLKLKITNKNSKINAIKNELKMCQIM